MKHYKSFVGLALLAMAMLCGCKSDEEGTKASAVTVAAVMAESNAFPGGLAERPMKVDFHCDRPFVYLIREATSGTIFFIGTFQGN